MNYAIALTGGIATGKSTLSSLLRLSGFEVIDADEISHEILDSFASDIGEKFGKEFVKDEKVNRAALGELVFGDSEAKRELEEFMFPKIHDKILALSKIKQSQKVPFFVDIPLFFETKNYPWIEKSVVVYAPYELQLSRLTKRSNLSEQMAKQRVTSQMDIEKKVDLADFVVDNSKDLTHLQEEFERLKIWIKDIYAGIKI